MRFITTIKFESSSDFNYVKNDIAYCDITGWLATYDATIKTLDNDNAIIITTEDFPEIACHDDALSLKVGGDWWDLMKMGTVNVEYVRA